MTAQQATDSPKQPKPTKPRPKNFEHIQNSSNQAAEQPKPTKPRLKNLAIYHFWKTAQGSLVTAQQATDSPKQPKPTKPRPKNLEHIQNSSNQAAEQPKPTKPRPKNLAIYHFRRQL